MNKIKCTLIIILLTYAVQGQTPNTWEKKQDLPGGARADAISFSVGGFGYVGLGLYRADTFGSPQIYYTDLWQYDPTTDTWTQKANFPAIGRYNEVCFVIGSKAYIGMGVNQNSNPFIKKDFWEYDPITDTWTQKTDFAGAARQLITGFSIGDKGYVGLGQSDTSNGAHDLWEYDPLMNNWIRKADCPGAYESLGFSINDKGYAGFGIDTIPGSYIPIKHFWEYDPAIDTWTKKADYAGEATLPGGSFGFSIGHYGYVGTGTYLYTYCNDFWQYDPSQDIWIDKDSFGGGKRISATGFSIGNEGYAGFGGNGTNNYLKDFWHYTPDSIETAIKKIEDEMYVSFYPNPVENSGMLQINTDVATNATINLIDQQGRVIESIYKGQLSNGTNAFDVNTKPLSAGLYMIGINSAEGIKTIKFIKYE